MRRRIHSAERGYTFVEILIAMAVFSVGAAGVISMQKVAVQSNLDTRMFDVANSIARRWVERAHIDATGWIDGASCPGPGCFTSAALLMPSAAWRFPTDYNGVPRNWEVGSDFLGRDVSMPTSSDVVFCTQIRAKVIDGSSDESICDPANSGGFAQCQANVVQFDVRVYWPRKLGDAYAPGCVGTQTTADALPVDLRSYHYVYATTAIRPTGVQ
jgi:prepilin-type N-terminal cleavage/methylation domain-containing protein